MLKIYRPLTGYLNLSKCVRAAHPTNKTICILWMFLFPPVPISSFGRNIPCLKQNPKVGTNSQPEQHRAGIFSLSIYRTWNDLETETVPLCLSNNNNN